MGSKKADEWHAVSARDGRTTGLCEGVNRKALHCSFQKVLSNNGFTNNETNGHTSELFFELQIETESQSQ